MDKYVENARCNTERDVVFGSGQRRPEDTAYNIKPVGDYDRGSKTFNATRKFVPRGVGPFKPRVQSVSHISNSSVPADEESDDGDSDEEGYEARQQELEGAVAVESAEDMEPDEQEMLFLGKGSGLSLAEKKKLACMLEIRGGCKYGSECIYSHDEGVLKAKVKADYEMLKNSKYMTSLRSMQGASEDRGTPRAILTKKPN
jgi:hypothetical protein